MGNVTSCNLTCNELHKETMSRVFGWKINSIDIKNKKKNK